MSDWPPTEDPGKKKTPTGLEDDSDWADDDPDRTRLAEDLGAPPPVPQPGTAAARTTHGTVKLGTRINNNYEITAVLKAGGMGEVYRGENVFTHDPVAIKLVKPDLANDEKIALMFRREARTLGQLVDDAIVRYYNFVQDPEINRYCLVMEFIEGTPLSDLVENRGPLTVAEARGLMRRLASGLGKAHAMDVVHRDLSPDNVMLPGGDLKEAKLIDFGIARSPLVTEGTMAGQFAGKFKYVSPEQLGHYDGAIGPVTDVYGLGLLIAAAVRGEALPMGASIVEAVEARRAVPDLSSLPEELRPILSHMLQPDPADRPKDMATVIAMLNKRPDTAAPVAETPAAPVGVPVSPPPFSAPPQTGSGLRLPPGPGAFQQPVAPRQTTPPRSLAAEEEVEPSNTGKLLVALVILFAGILGGAGFYGWREGLFGGQTVSALPGTGPVETPGDPPPPASDTREGFLAAYPAGSCAFAQRRATGPMSGLVEGFGLNADWSALPDAYDAAFGSRPDVVARELTAAQCAVLDFVAPQAGTDGGAPLEVVLDVETLVSGTALTGRIIDPLARPVWLALVTPDGSVWNVTDRLSGAVGDRRALRVGLELPPGGEAAGQLLLAVAAPRALASASTAAGGTPAQDLLPLIAAEIARRGDDVAVSLALVTLTPPEQAPQEVPGTDDASQDAPAPDAPDPAATPVAD
ncbi:serine/threonine-protein kinase [Jannaschia pohangensis]|nr:serine/threonine-protein kinase [Jannaschia pohangensis]